MSSNGHASKNDFVSLSIRSNSASVHLCLRLFILPIPVSLFLYPSNSRPIGLPLFVSISSSCVSLALVVFIFPFIPSLYCVSSYVVCLSFWSANLLSIGLICLLSVLSTMCLHFFSPCLFSTVLLSLGLLFFHLSDLCTSVCQISLSIYYPSVSLCTIRCVLSFRSLQSFGFFALLPFAPLSPS